MWYGEEKEERELSLGEVTQEVGCGSQRVWIVHGITREMRSGEREKWVGEGGGSERDEKIMNNMYFFLKYLLAR